MLNEIFLLQILSTLVLFFFNFSINILLLWYLAGIFLISAGLILIIDNCDIFIGFLWVIDLGVGLIFFIFILHFSNFLYQKINFALTTKFFFLFSFFLFFLLILLFFFLNPTTLNFNYELQKTWFFFLSWYDYYNFFFLKNITELQLLRELYFYHNSFEFFLINLILFYSIILVINFTFFLKKIFNFFYLIQIKNFHFFKKIKSNNFIRNQNFIKQQNMATGSTVWKKKTFKQKK